MSYQISSRNLTISAQITNLIYEKLKKIERHLQDFSEELMDIKVVLNKGPRFGYIVQIDVFVPKKTFVANSGNFNIEGAMDDAVEEIIKQIDRHKGKLSKERSFKVRRRLKNFMFFNSVFGGK